ncbi:hypothetical protein EV207_110104 [Scopulibacillus darangshiensis]|uniref:Uncharacterized protein n=1 Tax=Scopulibacillus darangshiensis TaxID=442528 RepID=A0A4R2P434_9BACL|nr:hypothetical protein [Scopulibacillus darangshiensis]TCP29483.1 hypothetical protein EV207_110104 [Scopulibacillus darangshiensis]
MGGNNRLQLLKVMEILRTERDEENELTLKGTECGMSWVQDDTFQHDED